MFLGCLKLHHFLIFHLLNIMIDYIFWNSIKNKPHDTDVIAEPNDIVDYLDGVLFLCQRKDDNNNCVCFRLENS